MKIVERRSLSVAGRAIHALNRRLTERVVLVGMPGKAPRKRLKTKALSSEEMRLDAELEALDIHLSRLREKVERLATRIRDRENPRELNFSDNSGARPSHGLQ